MDRTSFLFLAEGFEEIEALTVVDVMRRAELPVVTVSIGNSRSVKGAHGIVVDADALFTDADFSSVEWLILPGGMPGASNLYNFAPLRELLLKHNTVKGKIAAICASPAVVLAQSGILKGKHATCYPGFEDLMEGAEVVPEPVVVDKNIITSHGPASAMQFALAIVAAEKGEEVAYEIASGMLLYPHNHQYYF